MVRVPCEKNGVKKGPWTPEEDQKLLDYIHKFGYGNWRTLPKNAGIVSPSFTDNDISKITRRSMKFILNFINCYKVLNLETATKHEFAWLILKRFTFFLLFYFELYFTRSYRVTEVRKELSSSLDKLFEARYQER